MSIAHVRSTTVAVVLSVLALLLSVVPAPGAQTPVPDTARLTAAVQDTTVLLTGAVDDVAEAVAEAGGSVLGRLPMLGVTVAEVPADARADVASVPGVTVTDNERVELQDADGSLTEHPADDQGPATLGAPELWEDKFDGSGIGIAVLDTGVSEVDDLKDRVREGVDLSGEGDGVDSYGHGTPVASLAAGTSTGVAPGAHVVPVKIAGRDGVTDIARLLIGLEWIARHAEVHDIRVVNLSVGSTPVAAPLLDAAVQQLWDLGLVVVVAAGNDGPDSVGTPGSNTHVITVGATQGKDTATTADDTVAPWSATGVDADGNAKPDLVAPGQSLVVAGSPGSWAYTSHEDGHLDDGYQRASGTSFSTGLISGAAALLLEAHPSWSNDEVLGTLVATGVAVDGGSAPTPQLGAAVASGPVAANTDATGAPDTSRTALLRLGPPDPVILRKVIGAPDVVRELGIGWYGIGWYERGPKFDEPKGRGRGLADKDWSSIGWYDRDFSSIGWYDKDWSSIGWYDRDFSSIGWYDKDWSSIGWYDESWSSIGWYGEDWSSIGWYSIGWYSIGWYTSDWSGIGWYGADWA